MELVSLPDDRHQRMSDPAGTATLHAARPVRPKHRTRAAERLEKAQDAASVALGAVSSYLETDLDLPVFFRHLCETVAGLVAARRVAFWRLGSNGALSMQPEPFGMPIGAERRSISLKLVPGEQGILERVLFGDELPPLARGTCAELDAFWEEHGLEGTKNSIAVSWRAGERRIGILAAYDSSRGFTSDDAWVLRMAATATGLVWQYREAEEELDVTVERLEESMVARRNLLANVASGGDEARRRFASTLHDDSLQLLTAAELQLERIRTTAGGAAVGDQLDQLATTMKKVEDSLRRLLINVSAESIDLHVGLTDAIRDRLDTLRKHTGIESDVDLRLPSGLPEQVEALVFKSVAEALTNVEKHAHASRVNVSAGAVDGGIAVEVVDNGTGFVVAESLYVPGHLGLLAMKERAQLAGGWCRIASEPGAGTRVEFWIPNAD